MFSHILKTPICSQRAKFPRLDSSSSCHLPKTKLVQTYTKSHTNCPKQRAIRLLTHVFCLYRHFRSLHVDYNFKKKPTSTKEQVHAVSVGRERRIRPGPRVSSVHQNVVVKCEHRAAAAAPVGTWLRVTYRCVL